MKLNVPLIVCVFSFAAASTFAFPVNKKCQPANFPSLKFKEKNIFPRDKSLHRPEDGKALPDGRIVVGDENSGLRIVKKDGSSRPFGKFNEVGFTGNSEKSQAAPNGVFLEKDGRHLLVSDVYTGRIYRVDSKTEKVTLIYRHSFGVNYAIRDTKGNIWFSQSTDNTLGNAASLYSAIDRPKKNGKVYFLRGDDDKFATKAQLVAADIFFANGLALNKNETKLFVSETMMNRVLSFDANLNTPSLTNRQTYAYILTPDNIAIDSQDNIAVASPLSNSVIAVDAKCRSVHTIFSAPSTLNSEAQNKWVINSNLGLPLLSLVSPESAKPLPGLLTGMFCSHDHKTLYATGLGNAIVKISMKEGTDK